MKNSSVTPQSVFKEYDKGLSYNARINLDDTVAVNENFFIGKQWEGVQSNGLPTPQINILKRGVLFQVASITANTVTMQASPMSATVDKKECQRIADIINAEFDALFETNKISSLMREYARNAAVDGDGCTYTYWDDTAETGQAAKGAIVTEIIDNTRVFFGNPSDRRVQKQPYILISRREMLPDVRRRAKANNCKGWDSITPDSDEVRSPVGNFDDDKVTVLLRLWKNRDTGTVWACECTRNALLKKPWDTRLTLYPVTWLNWDYVKDSYHGMAMVTGLVPNQEFINKTYAMSQVSLMTSAFPKIIFDKTKIRKWDNRVGAAIGVNGGDVSSAAKIIDPAQISPQITQFIEHTIADTQSSMGATQAALGDVRPDNTSAIIALQRAAAIPAELTKQNLYQSIEDLGRIYIDFMSTYYGIRQVEMPIPEQVKDAARFAGLPADTKIQTDFDFRSLKPIHFSLKLDVGASSYWAEMATTQTIENLLMQGKISTTQFLERLPDSYVTKRQELIDELQAESAAAPDAAPGEPERTSSAPKAPAKAGSGDAYRQLQQGVQRGTEE